MRVVVFVALIVALPCGPRLWAQESPEPNARPEPDVRAPPADVNAALLPDGGVPSGPDAASPPPAPPPLPVPAPTPLASPKNPVQLKI